MATSVAKKPAKGPEPPPAWKDQPLFNAEAEPRAREDEWRMDDPPASIGTLPREVYQALCVLRQHGPCDAQALGKHIVKYYDWDLFRIQRVVTRLAGCGFVEMGAGGLLSVKA